MCYGNLDPRLVLREMDGRLEGVASPGETREPALPAAPPGLPVWVRGIVAWLKRKEATDV
jgi:hypothetical protein